VNAPRYIRKKPKRLRMGKGFPSIDSLVAYLGDYPSVWYRVADKPMPSAFVASMQFRNVVGLWCRGQFARVVRP